MGTRVIVLAALLFGAVACGGGAEPASDGSDASVAMTPARAAEVTARFSAACRQLGDFYWEIGDASGTSASGAIGTTYDATTKMAIASASKFLFGAYVLERFSGDVTKVDQKAMTMRSGYVSLSYDLCLLTSTVQACHDIGDNDVYTPADDGHFYYDGGHYQNYAVALGLGPMTSARLAAEVGGVLGSEIGIDYDSPQLAAGANMSASSYARFLRKVLSNGLKLHDHLSDLRVCTLPGSPGCDAIHSPSPYPWHYSYGHWIEDDPAGDGSFSSPGAFGFYPWIDAAIRHYGIVARKSAGAGAAFDSANCGRAIRAAWFTGNAQP
jgi:hypothetical protein